MGIYCQYCEKFKRNARCNLNEMLICNYCYLFYSSSKKSVAITGIFYLVYDDRCWWFISNINEHTRRVHFYNNCVQNPRIKLNLLYKFESQFEISHQWLPAFQENPLLDQTYPSSIRRTYRHQLKWWPARKYGLDFVTEACDQAMFICRLIPVTLNLL